MKKFLGHKAGEDDEFLDCKRKVEVDGTYAGMTSYREMRQNAVDTIKDAENGEASPEEGGLAIAVAWLVDQVIRGSDLLREAHALIERGAGLNREAKKHLENYRDHMLEEHGVLPEGLGKAPDDAGA